jgi:hypothetical protein
LISDDYVLSVTEIARCVVSLLNADAGVDRDRIAKAVRHCGRDQGLSRSLLQMSILAV